MPKYTLTAKFVKSIEPANKTVIYFDDHEAAPKGFGIRVTPAGTKSWILNYYAERRQRRLTLKYGFPAWGPQKARLEADQIKTKILNDKSDPLAEREEKIIAEQRAEAEKVIAEEIAEKARMAKEELTLGALLLAYADQLRCKGKSSARAVENSLRKNVEVAFPALWNTPAEDIGIDDLVQVIRRLVKAGKRREAAKVRAYLRAAYTVGVQARHDTEATETIAKFKLTNNPAADIKPIKDSVQSRERVLSLPELRLYYKRLAALPSPDGAVLMFHLLTGGQRLEQLFRLADKDKDDDSIILYDTKGRRTKPRTHLVPLLPEAKTALAAIGDGPYLISFDGGTNPATDALLRVRFKDVVKAMLNAEETKEPFTPGDIRRTVETRLAAAGVTSDHLAHLLSHGLGGVQAKHYNKHDYHAEKLAALVILRDLITAPPGDVIPIKRTAAKENKQ